MQDPPIPIPEVLQSQTMYKGFFEVREDLLKLPHGPKRVYSVLLTAPEAAVILAETANGKLVLNKEYRHPTKKWLYGCPGGSIDPGESPIEAGKRELLEETGYTAESFHLIGSAYPFPASCSQRIHYILAKNAKLTHPTAHEPFELIHVDVKSLPLLNKEMKEGALIDGILCTALYFRDLFYKSDLEV